MIDDREGDFYAHWALTPKDNVHHLSRAMHDRALVGGETLYEAIKRTPFCGEAAKNETPVAASVLEMAISLRLLREDVVPLPE